MKEMKKKMKKEKERLWYLNRRHLLQKEFYIPYLPIYLSLYSKDGAFMRFLERSKRPSMDIYTPKSLEFLLGAIRPMHNLLDDYIYTSWKGASCRNSW